MYLNLLNIIADIGGYLRHDYALIVTDLVKRHGDDDDWSHDALAELTLRYGDGLVIEDNYRYFYGEQRKQHRAIRPLTNTEYVALHPGSDPF